MTWAILANYSSTNVVPIIINDIVIDKEEVKELKCFKELSFFDILACDPKCELVLELASTIN